MSQPINVLPAEFDFTQPALKLGGITKRQQIYCYPEGANGGYSAQNSIIRFRLDRGMLDLRDCTLQFNATAAQTGGTYVCFSAGISCIINRMRVLIGSSPVLEDILNFNQLFAMWLLAQKPDFLSTTAYQQMGYTNTQATRITDAASTTRVYTLPLGYISDLLNRVWPANYFNDQLTIELYLEQTGYCLESDASLANISYTVNNVQFHYAHCEISEAFKSTMESQLAKGITIVYKSWDNFTNQLVAGSTNTQIVLPIKRQALTGIVYCARNNANVGSPATNDKFQTFLNYSVYNSSRLKINNDYYPSDRQLSVWDCYNDAIEFWDQPFTDSIFYGSNWTQYFITALSITQNPKHLDDNETISGLDCSKSSSTITAEIILNSPGAAVLEQLQFYAQFYAMLVISSGKIEQIQ